MPSKFLNWIAERVFLPQTAPASVPPLIDTLCLVNSTHSILKRPLSFTFIPHWPPCLESQRKPTQQIGSIFLYYEYSMPNFCLHMIPYCHSFIPYRDRHILFKTLLSAGIEFRREILLSDLSRTSIFQLAVLVHKGCPLFIRCFPSYMTMKLTSIRKLLRNSICIRQQVSSQKQNSLPFIREMMITLFELVNH